MLDILNYSLYKHAWIDKRTLHHGGKLRLEEQREFIAKIFGDYLFYMYLYEK